MDQYKQQNTDSPATPILTRAFIFLEDGDWKNATAYCERALDTDPQNAYAYLGKLMAKLKVKKPEDLQYCKKPFDDYDLYQKAIRFGDEQLVTTLTGYVTQIKAQKKSSPRKSIIITAAIILTVCVCALCAIIAAKLWAPSENLASTEDTTASLETTGSTEAVTPSDTVQVGDYVKFGSYEQDADLSSSSESIEWLVLDVQDGYALLISKYALDCLPYHIAYEDTTYENSTLRGWLNDDFINTAFSAFKRSAIATTIVPPGDNPATGIDAGNATADQIFLLSIDEANKYLPSADERVCQPTFYAYVMGTTNNTCIWWLRSPGGTPFSAAAVDRHGRILDNGDFVNVNNVGIRPAMWVSIDAL